MADTEAREGSNIKRVAVGLTVLGVAATACVGSASRLVAGREGTTGTAARPRVERTVSVYAAVIRQLVTKDHGSGGADPGFRVVYVIDGSVEGAENPRSVGEPKPEKPFDRQVKRGLRKALADLLPLRFVKDLRSVIAGEPRSVHRYCSLDPASCRVINNGVLLTLGPIRGSATRVEVGTSLWIDLLAGGSQTYVLERRVGGWGVVGTTGPRSIS